MNAEDGAVASARAMMIEHGVAIQYVFPRYAEPGPYFAYTIGLTIWDHPELLIAGLPPEVSQEILNTLAARVREGETLTPGDVCIDVLPDDYDVVIAGPVEAAAEGGEYAIRIAREVFAETELPLPYQVVYPDAGGRFPWDPQSEQTGQPLLAPEPFHTISAWEHWRVRAMHWLGQVTPESWRWLHHLYAWAGRFFWLPCPLCERPFGGHEWRDIDGKPSQIPSGDEDGLGQGICPRCTRAGRGVRLSAAGDDDADERL